MKKNLYTETGEPKRLACYWWKTTDFSDNITVVLTHADKIDEVYKGSVLYIGMTESGNFHYGSYSQHTLKPGGSRVKFSDLPIPCQNVVRDIYKKVWEDGYFIMA